MDVQSSHEAVCIVKLTKVIYRRICSQSTRITALYRRDLAFSSAAPTEDKRNGRVPFLVSLRTSDLQVFVSTIDGVAERPPNLFDCLDTLEFFGCSFDVNYSRTPRMLDLNPMRGQRLSTSPTTTSTASSRCSHASTTTSSKPYL